MLDLVIETEQKDQEEKIVFKLWMHNISQSLQSSIHNQIIEEIHYSRCSHFIFLYAEGNAKSYNEANLQYEKTKQIKSDNFKATFIGVSTLNSQNQISNLTQIKDSEDDAQEDLLPQAKIGKFNRRISVQQNKLTSCIRDLCQFKERDIQSSSTSSTSSISSTSSTSSSSSLASSFKRQRQNMINSTALSPLHHIIINNQQQLLTQYQDESLQINTIQVNE